MRSCVRALVCGDARVLTQRVRCAYRIYHRVAKTHTRTRTYEYLHDWQATGARTRARAGTFERAFMQIYSLAPHQQR